MRWLAWLSVLCFISLAPPAGAQAAPISLKDWATPGAIWSLTISPDGKRVAGMLGGRTTGVFLLDLDNGHNTVVAHWEPNQRYRYGAWPLAVHWIADDLLAVDYSTRESVSVDLAGKRKTELGERFVRRLVEKGASSDWVLVLRDIDDGDIGAVNARTGERRSYRIALPGKLIHWAFDASGALRAVTMMDTTSGPRRRG